MLYANSSLIGLSIILILLLFCFLIINMTRKKQKKSQDQETGEIIKRLTQRVNRQDKNLRRKETQNQSLQAEICRLNEDRRILAAQLDIQNEQNNISAQLLANREGDIASLRRRVELQEEMLAEQERTIKNLRLPIYPIYYSENEEEYEELPNYKPPTPTYEPSAPPMDN